MPKGWEFQTIDRQNWLVREEATGTLALISVISTEHADIATLVTAGAQLDIPIVFTEPEISVTGLIRGESAYEQVVDFKALGVRHLSFVHWFVRGGYWYQVELRATSALWSNVGFSKLRSDLVSISTGFEPFQ